MAGYPHLSKVQDPAAYAALKSAFDQIAALKTEITDLRTQVLLKPSLSAQGVDVGGLRLTNLATPTGEADALTVGFARQLIRAEVETFGL